MVQTNKQRDPHIFLDLAVTKYVWHVAPSYLVVTKEVSNSC